MSIYEVRDRENETYVSASPLGNDLLYVLLSSILFLLQLA